MARVLLLISLGLSLLFVGCAPKKPVPESAARIKHTPAPKLPLWDPCTPDQATKLADQAHHTSGDALSAAACMAGLAANATNTKDAAQWTDTGYDAAAVAVEHYPDNAQAQYLLAYLAGIKARIHPGQGLDLVRMIAKHAQLAAKIDPKLDKAGPDRMLGFLYLQAPGFPISIGDLDSSLEHFKKAVSIDPDFYQNRAGLALAYDADEELAQACAEVYKVMSQMSGEKDKTLKQKISDLNKKCSKRK